MTIIIRRWRGTVPFGEAWPSLPCPVLEARGLGRLAMSRDELRALVLPTRAQVAWLGWQVDDAATRRAIARVFRWRRQVWHCLTHSAEGSRTPEASRKSAVASGLSFDHLDTAACV